MGVSVYHFAENEAYIILMLTLIFFVLWSLPMSYIMDYYGYHIQWNILSSFLFFLSLLFLIFGSKQNKLYPIISLSILSISTLFVSSHFTLTILSTKPIELAPYVASIITVLHWFFTVIFNDFITWLDLDSAKHAIKASNAYLDSILFVLFISFLQFVISALVYGITVKSQLNLHHPTPNKTNKQNLLFNTLKVHEDIFEDIMTK